MPVNFKDLLDKVQEESGPVEVSENFHSRVLVIDALNLFFRNFATINIVNKEGVHIGGLVGFLRSLGALINLVQPTGVYIIFDGVGSSTNRKNLLPEYKSNRGLTRITNWDTFDSLEEEDEAKVGQITRLIHYLQCLPLKVGMIDKAEADDMIAYLSEELPKRYNSHVTIVSSDKDYMQLVNDKVTLYRPIQKSFYDDKKVLEEFGLLVENFIIMKTLLGDGSDSVAGIKGMGLKTMLKIFPELKERKVTLDEIFDICEAKLGKHKLYAVILHNENQLRIKQRIMDLSKPVLDDRQIDYIDQVILSDKNEISSKTFLTMYENDGLGNVIRNVDFWLKDIFERLNEIKS